VRLDSGAVDLDDPASTLALLKANVVMGVTGFFDSQGRIVSIGIQCALCHSTVDDGFAPGIGGRLDGWPNRDLDIGAVVALAPTLLLRDADGTREMVARGYRRDPDNGRRELGAEFLEVGSSAFFDPRTLDVAMELDPPRSKVDAIVCGADFGFRVDAPQLNILLKGMQKIANRILTGLVICGALIASAMLQQYRPRLGTWGFGIAAAIGLYMVVTIAISDRKN